MSLVLDASTALAWCIARTDPNEAGLAQQTLANVQLTGACAPALWYAEVANTLLVFERAKRFSQSDSACFLSDLSRLAITPDETPMARLQPQILAAARTYQLTAYDATYLELALRKGTALATFDRKLAEAFRKAGGCVFGDQP